LGSIHNGLKVIVEDGVLNCRTVVPLRAVWPQLTGSSEYDFPRRRAPGGSYQDDVATPAMIMGIEIKKVHWKLAKMPIS